MNSLLLSQAVSAKTLTRRQQQILELVIKGHTNAQIAHLFNISPRTVEGHRALMMRRWGVNNTAGLVRMALEQKLIFD